MSKTTYQLAMDDGAGHHEVLPYAVPYAIPSIPTPAGWTPTRYEAAIEQIRGVVRDWIRRVGADKGCAAWTLFTADGEEIADGSVATSQ